MADAHQSGATPAPQQRDTDTVLSGMTCEMHCRQRSHGGAHHPSDAAPRPSLKHQRHHTILLPAPPADRTADERSARGGSDDADTSALALRAAPGDAEEAPEPDTSAVGDQEEDDKTSGLGFGRAARVRASLDEYMDEECQIHPADVIERPGLKLKDETWPL